MGNVLVKYRHEQDAARAVDGLRGRFYWGRAIQAELSSVTDFSRSSCRQYEEGFCKYHG